MLARALEEYRGRDLVVLGLPRGGVEVARQVADSLEAPLNILSVRKIPHPLSPEYAIAAITEHGTYLESKEDVRTLPQAALKRIRDREYKEALRRRELYTGGALPSLQKKTVIIVDDGLATGLTMKAAILDVQKHNPANILVAAPVAHVASAVPLLPMVEDVICLVLVAGDFGGVGSYYDYFPQLTDGNVIGLLKTRGGFAKPETVGHR